MGRREIDVASMRRWDAIVGRPLCALATIARRSGGSDDPSIGPMRRILLVKLAEQGATVAARPALLRAIDMVGADNVFVAVFVQNRFVLDELRLIPQANVLTVRTTGPLVFTYDMARLIMRCRRLKIDAGVDLEFFSRISALILFLSGARRRSGLHSWSGEGPRRGDLMTHRLSANPVQHVSHTFLALVEALDQPVDRLPALDLGPWPLAGPPSIETSDAERTRVRTMVTKASGGSGDRPIVLLNPNTSDIVPLRRWPVERYVELAQRLLADFPELLILITGSPAEASQARATADAVASERCASVAGLTSMRELLVLYELSEVLVTNDSGPAHYATLTSVDVVVLFGPETPAVFGPVSRRSHHLWAAVPCSPCVNSFNGRVSPCRDNVCMQRLSTDTVFERVSSLYRARQGELPAHRATDRS